MKKVRTSEQIFVRGLITDNKREGRRISKEIRDYARYDLQKRNITGIYHSNLQYLTKLCRRYKENSDELQTLYEIYLKTI